MKKLIHLFTILLITNLINIEVQAQPEANKLLIEFLFDDDNGRSANNTGSYNKDGEIRGDYNHEPGVVGKALEFNDKDVIVHFEDDNELDIQNFTIMTWVKPYSRGSDSKRIEIIEKTNSYWMNIRIDDGIMRCGCFFQESTGSNEKWYYIDSDTPVNLNEWTHVAFTVNNNNMVSYINGRETSKCKVPDIVTNTPGPFAVGSRQNMEDDGGGAAFFHGLMDEFRVFTSVLTQSEISEWMTANHKTTQKSTTPQNIKLENADNARIKITWDKTGEGTCEYEVFRSTNNSDWISDGFVKSESNSYYCSGLLPNENYFFKVRAVGKTGLSSFSETKQITTGNSENYGLVAHYKFENDVKDNFGEHHGIIYGNVDFSNGKNGKAIKFSGNQFIEVPQYESDDFSVSMWVKTNQNENNNKSWFNQKDAAGLVDGGVAGYSADFGTAMTNGKFAFGTGVDDQTAVSNKRINNNQWHHVAATYSNNNKQMKVYVDGDLQDSETGRTKNPKNAGGVLTIGKLRDHNFTDGYFRGLLDDIMIYNRELAYNEINDIILSAPELVAELKKPKVYPNPANNYLYIEPGNNELILVRLYNVNGKICFQKALSPINKQMLNIHNLVKGTYILEMQGKTETYREKIIITK